MSKVISIKRAIRLSKSFHANKKSLVICGGCFDILHLGHIKFLKNAKKRGNYLFVLLESDESVNKLKGVNRPIHPQSERAEILSAITFIDYIILLNSVKTNNDYDRIIKDLNPEIIAVTKNSPTIEHNKRQAKLVNAKVIEVIAQIPNKSSTKLAARISQDF